MKGILLDSNHASAWAANAPAIMAHLNKRPVDMPARVCSITLGEMECGNLVNPTTDQARRDEERRFIVRELHPFVLCMGKHTASYYARIIKAICENTSRPADRPLREHLKILGVQVNDVWIVAVAWEHNLTMLTTDKMQHIRDAVGSAVEFDDWCA